MTINFWNLTIQFFKTAKAHSMYLFFLRYFIYLGK